MFTTYKNLFCSIVSCFKNDFSGIENKPVPGELEDKENNGTNVDNLVAEILKDRKLDKDDALLLDNLIKEFNSLKEKGLDESYNATQDLMKEVLESVIENGYEINSEADYEMFKKSNKAFLNGEIQLPEYDAKILKNKVLVSDTASKRIYINEQSLAFGSGNHYIENGNVIKMKSSRDHYYNSRFNDNKIDVDNLISKQSKLFNTLTKENKEYFSKELPILNSQLNIIETKKEEYKNNLNILSKLSNIENTLKSYIDKLENNGEIDRDLYKEYISKSNSLKDEISNSKNKDKQETKTENKTETEVKKETKKEKVSSSDIEGSRVDNENISWNINEFNSKGIALINKSLGISGDKFTKETLKKIYEISTDGKIGLGVLKKLALVDPKNNAINGLTKEMFNSGALEKGNSSKIIFNEKVEVKKSPEKTTIEVNKTEKQETEKQEIKEENKKVEQKEDSILNNVKEGFSESGDYISEKFNSLKEWIKELFETDEQLAKFVGKNGLEVGIDYNKDTNEISLDTSYFDSVLDYKVEGIPKDVDTKEEALAYIKSQISKIKEVYDNKTAETDLRNSIAHKQRMKEDFGHELPFTKEEIEFMNKETKKEEKKEKIEEVKKEQKVEVKETEVKVSDNISLKYDSENIKNIISSLEEGSSSYKAEIGSFGEGQDVTKYEQKINVYKMAGKTYLEVDSGSLWKANPDMRIKSEKDINEKNINKLISQLEK